MEELTDYSSAVVEFKPSAPVGKCNKLVDIATTTDPLPTYKSAEVQTNRLHHAETQTEINQQLDVHIDDQKLAKSLQKMYSLIEVELQKGTTPLLDDYDTSDDTFFEDETKIQTYQKIVVDSLENSQGLAIWLSVHTNNAPVLVVTTVASHDDWCEHINQSMKIFMPKRMLDTGIVAFTEVKSVPIKCCLKYLCTNPFNKNIFAGSMLDGDIYVWQYEHPTNGNTIEIRELFKVTSPQDYAVAMDWASENHLLTCHSNGIVLQWLVGKEMLKESEYAIKPVPSNASNEITTLICVRANEFVVGTNDGGVYYCWNWKKNIEITPLRRHLFSVSTLLKQQIAGYIIIVSCDPSGQIIYHDIRNADDDSSNVLMEIPLAFKNAIACSIDASIIYCPGVDGSLECYRVSDSLRYVVQGALRGKGNVIKRSDNGHWIVTGLYGNDFQIFHLEN